MVGNNQNPPPNEPWLPLDAFSIPRLLHDMLKHPETFLPKFDLEKKDSVEDHVKKFLSAISLQNIRYEDVVCRLFPRMFEKPLLLFGRSLFYYLEDI
jgi:hypothetical protein